MMPKPVRLAFALMLALFAAPAALSADTAAPDAEAIASSLRVSIDKAVETVRPALVRIHVVDTYYRDGREMKYESSGSGVVISPDGHIVTNHHVAGHAKQLKCTFADKREYEADVVGTDPLTDIAVIKVRHDGETFPTVTFGDSDTVRVGDHVLAMGSPLALSQSVTLGIVSNAEMILPDWMSRYGGLEQDGENVGALVRWIGHDAAIFGGNSGGPLVNLQGEIIGINEISMGLGGAIPGNLARDVSKALIDEGLVRRAWLGIEVQPRLKHADMPVGALVSGVIEDSPAAEAGVRAGDVVTALEGEPVDIQFTVQLPDFNLRVAELPIGEEIALTVLRDGEEKDIPVTTRIREPVQPRQYELKQWGITVRDISFIMAKELKRATTDGVLVTSVRPGGPAGDAKPSINRNDVIVEVGGETVKDVASLRAITEKLTEGAEEPVAVLTAYERKNQAYLTAVKVGIKDLQDPGLEVKRAWLPIESQVLTRDIAELLERPELRGFRVTHVFRDSTAEQAGLRVGDIIYEVDGEALTATLPEHYEELPALIRQYRVGTETELAVLRDREEITVPVELVLSPSLPREMKKYEDEDFEFTVRNVAFFDKAEEQWEEERQGVLVDQVRPGGWAALGQLQPGDLILTAYGKPVPDVDTMEEVMDQVTQDEPPSVVFKVLRGIRTFFIELEPKWDGR